MKQFAKKPIIFSGAVILAMMLLPRFLMPVIQILFGDLLRGKESLLYGLLYLLDTLVILILAFVCGKKLEMGFRFGISRKQLGRSMLLCLPMVLESVYSVWFYIQAGCPEIDSSEGFLAMLHALQSGITEEVVFRCLILGNLVYQWRSQREGYRNALLAAALMFSLSHLINVTSGQSLLTTAVQMVYAFAVGCLTGMAYLSTRNLLGPILIHSLHNCITMTLGSVLTGKLEISIAASGVIVCIKLLSYGVAVGYSMVMLRHIAQQRFSDMPIADQKTEVTSL